LSGLIAAILILSFSFSSTFTNHRAYATNYLVSDQASCEGLQVSGGSAVWGSFSPTDHYCKISGILTINSGDTLDIIDPVAFQLNTNSGINNFGTIQIDGSLQMYESGSFINNNGTIINNNAFVGNAIINNGTITNNGGLWIDNNLDSSGVISNPGYIVINSVLSNHGILENPSTIYNYGLIKNYNTINNSGSIDGTIDNSGTIYNKCGSIFSYVVGSQPINVCPNYQVKIFENGNQPTDYTFLLGQTVRVVAGTNDTSVSNVKFYWVSPSRETVREETMPISSPEDSFAPDQIGRWILEVHFSDGSVVKQPFYISIFFVTPESPVGSIAMVLVSVTVLGAFVYFRQYRNKAII